MATDAEYRQRMLELMAASGQQVTMALRNVMLVQVLRSHTFGAKSVDWIGGREAGLP